MEYNIQLDATFPNLKVSGKEELFRAMAEPLSRHSNYPQNLIVETLLSKEHQSPSGIGDGLAIPQAKIKGLTNRYVAIASLYAPLSFNSMDKKPVDLVCLLLSPESHGGLHLRGLSRLSRIMKNEELCQGLREANDADTMRTLFLNPHGWLLAA